MPIFFSTASVAHDKYQVKAPETIQFKSCFGHHFDLGSSTFSQLVDKVFLTYVDDAGLSNLLTSVPQALCSNLSHIMGIQRSPHGLNFLISNQPGASTLYTHSGSCSCLLFKAVSCKIILKNNNKKVIHSVHCNMFPF